MESEVERGCSPMVFPANSVLSQLSACAAKGLAEPYTDILILTKTEKLQAHRLKLAVSAELRCVRRNLLMRTQ